MHSLPEYALGKFGERPFRSSAVPGDPLWGLRRKGQAAIVVISNKHKIHYEVLRNVTSKADLDLKRERRCGVAPSGEFFDLPDDQNVRQYLETEVNGKKIKKRTDVNDAIRSTLEARPEDFAMLNSGITIVCTGATVDDKNCVLELTNASIINGSQTRGVLKDFYEEQGEGSEPPPIHFEVIVCGDSSLASDITIARNFQNRVIPVSTYGAKGLFDELEAAMRKHDPKVNLRKSETDLPENGFIDTEKLIQVITVIVPSSIKMPRAAGKEAVSGARAYAFSQKAVCLDDFNEIMTKSEYADAKRFFLEVAYDAHELYKSLHTHPAFGVFRQKSGKHERRSPVRKGPKGEVLDVRMGVLFPVMSALGNFAREDAKAGRWCLRVPKDYDMSDLVNQAYLVFANGSGDPAKMGKDPNSYAALQPMVTSYLKYRTA
ncbi:MAG: AIPR family protein [Myxococcales bacterium]|nr:AIPR family protein [Myxococcales bacterium]